MTADAARAAYIAAVVSAAPPLAPVQIHAISAVVTDAMAQHDDLGGAA